METSSTIPPRQEEPTGPAPGWKDRARVVAPVIPPGSPLLPFEGRDQRAAEHYRIIRTKIVQDSRALRVIAVTSPQVGDGKSVSSINIAGALALKNDVSVLLVEADLRRSACHALLWVPRSPGLGEVLTGECPLENAIVRLQAPAAKFYFLPAGQSKNNPAELLDSRAWTLCCAQLRREFDFVVIDTPPIGVVADYGLVESVSDGIILIIRPDHTERRRCFDALRTIPKARLVGVVANCVPDWFMTKSLYHDYAYYGERHG
jgi:capsular exopolysaccharide synthesis family protein